MTAAPLQFLLLMFAGWVNRNQLDVIDYLKEENRVLREQLGGRRLRFTDDQRRRLAAKGQVLGRRVLDELAGLVTPDTILRWYQKGRPLLTTTRRDSNPASVTVMRTTCGGGRRGFLAASAGAGVASLRSAEQRPAEALRPAGAAFRDPELAVLQPPGMSWLNSCVTAHHSGSSRGLANLHVPPARRLITGRTSIAAFARAKA
jgi:hypothetical protein